MSQEQNDSAENTFNNHFLVGLSSLEGDYFHHSLTLLVDHNAQGAFGLMINRPTEHRLRDIFPRLSVEVDCQVMEGGPVEQDKMFFLHGPTMRFDSTLEINSEVWLTTSQDIIQALEQRQPPTPLIPIVGYAGWGANQLEQELRENTWLITPSNTDILFSTSIDQKAGAAAGLLGVDLNLIAPLAGHD